MGYQERRPSFRGAARRRDTGHRTSERRFKVNQRKQRALAMRRRTRQR